MSFPASTSSSLSFAVTGKALQLQLPRPLHELPTRKIYNPTYFFNETYQHEIANHYRDYKRNTRIPRRRRRTIYVPYRRAAFYGVVSGEQRPVLPIAVHDFPRFTAVYTTPRGRQTLCEDAPPDGTYNATVRRIQQANSYKELKVLVEQQLRWSESRKCDVTKSGSGRFKVVYFRRKIPERKGFYSRQAVKGDTFAARKCEKSTNNDADVNASVSNANEKCYDYNDDDDDNDSNANDSVEQTKPNILRLSRSKGQEYKEQFNQKTLRTNGVTSVTLERARTRRAPRNQRCNTAVLTLNTSTHKVGPQTAQYNNRNKYPHNAKEVTAANSTAYFLQLACEYYEEGFLRNIKYLQAIGARNAAHRAQLKLGAKQQTSQIAGCSNNDESATATASATTSETNTPEYTPRIQRSAEYYFHLTYLLRRIGRKRSFKIGLNRKVAQPSSKSQNRIITSAESSGNDERLYSNPCAIRVKIKLNADQKEEATPYKSTNTATQLGKCTATTTLDGCSMNDYLNANSPTTISTATTLDHLTSSTVAARAHFHELIDHLMQLEISDIDASLPKITLTDCSSIGNGVGDGDSALVVNRPATGTTQTNDNAFAFEFNTTYNNSNNFSAYNAFHSQLDKQQEEQQQQPLLQHQLVQTSAHRKGFTLRETKFGALHSSLEIPDVVYYTSEARPP